MSEIVKEKANIKTHKDLNIIIQLGYDAILVGTSLMKTATPGAALAELLQRVPV